MTITVNGIDEMRSLVGRTIGPSDWREVTQDLIDRFADVSRIISGFMSTSSVRGPRARSARRWRTGT